MPVQFKPENRPSVISYLVVEKPSKLIEFVKTVFGAELIDSSITPDGEIMHAEIRIEDSIIMMGQASEEWKAIPAMLYIYVPDTDSVYQKALDAGAVSVMEPSDQFYGDRNAGVKDENGNLWWIATHVEDVTPEEMARREQEFMKKKFES